MLLKSFRLFVSSTFKDFAQERELLQSTVFPALDAYCAARGYQFHAVDLRWGVNEEAQLDQRTAEICLGEVSAAKGYPAPNFLIMIGDRYGWVPLPFAIAQDEFEAAVAWLESRGERKAVRNLRRVYQLDENHVIPSGLVAAPGAPGTAGTGAARDISAYTLRSREDEIAELKDPATWEKLEARLRTALQTAADHLLQIGRINVAGRQKYFLSLTEQEIIHGLPGYRRDSAPNSTATPKQVDPDGAQAIAWIRDKAAPRRAGLLRRWLAPSSARPEPDPKVAELASAIRRALREDSVDTATASASADGKLDQAYLDTFVSSVQRKLEAAIDARIAAVDKQQSEPDSELLIERAEHRAFAEEQRKVFVGRDSNLAAIATYIAGSGTHPLVLYGRSGSGKSALMARAVADAEAAGGAPVVYRFIGASAASSDQRVMLTSLVDDLAANGIAEKPAQWEDDANKFVAQVRELLSAIDKPVVIFLDALDQLRKPYWPAWLTEQLPSAVKIVVSVLDDEAFPVDSGVYKSLRQRLPADALLQIEPLGPAHGHDILEALEPVARRRLQPGQRGYIVRQFMKAGASPLYLRVAFEIARGWRSTDTAGAGGRELAEDTTALIAQFIDELSTLHHHEQVLVSRTLGFIAASKEGLSSSELTAILSRDTDVMQAISSEQHGARTAKLPVSVWVRLHRHLAALLVEKSVDEQPLMQFFHRQLAEVARERFYVGSKAALHGALATHFDTPIDLTADAMATSTSSGTIYSRRSLSELPYQFFHAESRSRLDELLMAPDWMQEKLDAFGPQPLIADYEEFGHGSVQTLIGRTLRLTAGILSRDARQLLPQLVGRLEGNGLPGLSTLAAEVRTLLRRPCLVTQTASMTRPGLAERFRIELGPAVRQLVLASGNQLIAATDGEDVFIVQLDTTNSPEVLTAHTNSVPAISLLTPDILATGSHDKTIKLWELGSKISIATLPGHGGEINTLTRLSDGRFASGAQDDTIRIWDTERRMQIARLSGHQSGVLSLSELPGNRLLSTSFDGTIRFWDLEAGHETARIVGDRKGDGIHTHRILSDRLIAFPSRDNSVRIFDIETGAECQRLIGHQGPVRAMVLLENGILASASYDRTIRMWDLTTSLEIGRLEGHTDWVLSLLPLPDGMLASGSFDGTIRIWNPQEAQCVDTSSETLGEIRAIEVIDAARVAVGYSDASIRIWNSHSRIVTSRLQGHAGAVGALASLPDGRIASGSDYDPVRIEEEMRAEENFRFFTEVDEPSASSESDSHFMRSGDNQNPIRIWDPASPAASEQLFGHRSYVNALAVWNEKFLVSASCYDVVRVWDFMTGDEVKRIKVPDGWVRSLAVLTNRRVAMGHGNHIRLWDLDLGVEVGCLDNSAPVGPLIQLPDGRLASNGADGDTVIWDLARECVVARLPGQGGYVRSRCVMPNGFLVTCSSDNTVRLWDVDSIGEVARLELDSAASAVAALPDGRLLVGDTLGRLHWLEVLL